MAVQAQTGGGKGPTQGGGGRTQPRVTPSVSNQQPSGVNRGAQFGNPTVTTPATGSLFSQIGNSIGHSLSDAWNGATHFIGSGIHNLFGNDSQQRAAEQRVHDVTSPKTTVTVPGYNNTGRIDPLSGYPIGNWAYNQDNSGGNRANLNENANGHDEYGQPTTTAHGFHLQPGQTFMYHGMKVTQGDFMKEKGSNEWDDWRPVKDVVPAKTITTQGTGANTNYQLGKQGAVGGNGGSYQLGSGLTANNAAVTGRGNGSLTNGMWSYGGSSGGYSGGATGSSFQGITGDPIEH